MTKFIVLSLVVFLGVVGATGFYVYRMYYTPPVVSSEGIEAETHEEDNKADVDIVTGAETGVTASVVEEQNNGAESVVNYYENSFIGLKFRYLDDWYSKDYFDVVVNAVKEAGVNKVNLDEDKLNRLLPLVSFEAKDVFNNTLDVYLMGSLEHMTSDFIDAVEADSEQDTKEDSSLVVEEGENVFDTDTFKMQVEDLLVASGGYGEVVLKTESEVYSGTEGDYATYTLNYVYDLYGQEYAVVVTGVPVGVNYMLLVARSLNEPNEIDKEGVIGTILSSMVKGW